MNKTFTGKTRLFLTISGAIILVALVMQIAGVGLNLGIDFTGGSMLTYSVGESYLESDVRQILDYAGYNGAQIKQIAPSSLETEQAATEAAENAADAVVENAEEAADAVAENAENAADAVVETAENAAEVVAETTDNAAEAVADTAETVTEGAEGAADAVADTAETVADGAETTDNAAEAVADTAETVTEGAEGAADAVADTAEAVADTAETVADGAEAVADGAEEATETASEIEYHLSNLDKSGIPQDDKTDLQIRLHLEEESEKTSQVRSILEKAMQEKYPNFRFISIDHVSAIAGRDLLSNAVKALLLAFVCMLIYIAIRFSPLSGAAALFALLHDILIMCAFMVFFRSLFQVNSSFIAAVLTIVGYSINNTIIIFDRIRETRKKPGYTQADPMDVVEVSVSSTLARTINTTLTTLFTLVCLYIFGVSAIREFAFPLIVGMLAGTYSSVLLSGQVWAMWTRKLAAKKSAKASK